MSGDGRYTTVSIPRPLYEKIKKRIEGTGFTSVSDFVTFVLREVLAGEEKEDVFSREDEERIRERLRTLGYLE